MVPPRCLHCGGPVRADGDIKPGRTPRYCSSRCRTRAHRGLPNTPRRHSNHTDLDAAPFDPRWVPRHPVDEPEVFARCSCGEALHRRGQAMCSDCRSRGDRGGLRRAEHAERNRIAGIRAATLRGDAIDRCRRCNDNGLRRDGSVCDHS